MSYFYGHHRVQTATIRPLTIAHTQQIHPPKWRVARGKVISLRDPMHIFRGNELLKVYVIDASRADATSIFLGSQKIRLQPGQRFPIRFQFSYDQSRATRPDAELSMQASIIDSYGRLIYVNDTHTPLVDNVKIDLKPERSLARYSRTNRNN